MKELERITIRSDSEIAQRVFSLDIDCFRMLFLYIVNILAKEDGVDRDELLVSYMEKNHELCSTFIKEINENCENVYDQLIHFALCVVNFALNFHGCFEYMQGELEIQELIGGSEDE